MHARSTLYARDWIKRDKNQSVSMVTTAARDARVEVGWDVGMGMGDGERRIESAFDAPKID